MRTTVKLIPITFALLGLAWVNVLKTESQPQAPPALTITRRIYERLDSGQVTDDGTQVEYRDSEGNVRVETKYLNPIVTNKINVFGKDNDVGWYAVGQREQQGTYIKTCPEPSTPARSFEQLRAQSDFLREDKALGFRVAVLRPNDPSADFQEVWIVPELDGVEVKRITHWPGLYYIIEATEITLGEPADRKARLPQGLKVGRDLCKEMQSAPPPGPPTPVPPTPTPSPTTAH